MDALDTIFTVSLALTILGTFISCVFLLLTFRKETTMLPPIDRPNYTQEQLRKNLKNITNKEVSERVQAIQPVEPVTKSTFQHKPRPDFVNLRIRLSLKKYSLALVKDLCDQVLKKGPRNVGISEELFLHDMAKEILTQLTNQEQSNEVMQKSYGVHNITVFPGLVAVLEKSCNEHISS